MLFIKSLFYLILFIFLTSTALAQKKIDHPDVKKSVKLLDKGGKKINKKMEGPKKPCCDDEKIKKELKDKRIKEFCNNPNKAICKDNPNLKDSKEFILKDLKKIRKDIINMANKMDPSKRKFNHLRQVPMKLYNQALLALMKKSPVWRTMKSSKKIVGEATVRFMDLMISKGKDEKEKNKWRSMKENMLKRNEAINILIGPEIYSHPDKNVASKLKQVYEDTCGKDGMEMNSCAHEIEGLPYVVICPSYFFHTLKNEEKIGTGAVLYHEIGHLFGPFHDTTFDEEPEEEEDDKSGDSGGTIALSFDDIMVKGKKTIFFPMFKALEDCVKQFYKESDFSYLFRTDAQQVEDRIEEIGADLWGIIFQIQEYKRLKLSPLQILGILKNRYSSICNTNASPVHPTGTWRISFLRDLLGPNVFNCPVRSNISSACSLMGPLKVTSAVIEL